MEGIALVISYAVSYGIGLLIIFFVTKTAVKSAIDEKLERINEVIRSEVNTKDLDDLIKLRDFELLNGDELEEVIKIYQNERVNKENYEQYLKYSKILNELKEMEYFNNEQYDDKINTLKKYYNID